MRISQTQPMSTSINLPGATNTVLFLVFPRGWKTEYEEMVADWETRHFNRTFALQRVNRRPSGRVCYSWGLLFLKEENQDCDRERFASKQDKSSFGLPIIYSLIVCMQPIMQKLLPVYMCERARAREKEREREREIVLAREKTFDVQLSRFLTFPRVI